MSSTTIDTTTVGQLVVERPSRARVFEQFGIDYCCGGRKPLAEACREKHVDPDAVARALRAEAQQREVPAERDWSAAPMGELIDHILDTHHAYLRAEVPRLRRLAWKVADVHGTRHPGLVLVAKSLDRLRSEMAAHLLNEERVLFPLCRRIDGAKVRPDALYGSLRNPIVELVHEHDETGAALAEMRQLTGNYTPPADACDSYRALLAGLARLEADMHQHVHLENNILFPRAVEAEMKLRHAAPTN